MKLQNKAVKSMPMKANPMVREIILNFLTNALKYAPDGKVVTIESVEKDGNYVIKTEDRGEGIPDMYKKTIFNRFNRLDRAGVKGFGLGLNIVSKLAEAHGGSVWVEDNPGGGAVFIVRLPKTSK